jgi:hypothetical protein
MTVKIGLLVGMEDTFPQAFLERANQRPGVHAELAKIGGTPERFEKKYDVLIDRISQEVKHYRFHLKAAALAGTTIVNDPFWWSADDKFFGYSLAAKLGIAVPRTVMLPQKEYIPAIDPRRSLRNLEYPLDWQGIVDYVGFPAILKPADGGGWRDVNVVRDAGELMAAYDASGLNVMTLQEFIDFDQYIRCICIGKDRILPIQYDPKRRCYVHNEAFQWLPKELHDRVMRDALTLNQALGYDMNSVEFAVRDGIPYAIDFTNPAPDMHRDSILPQYFDTVVEWMVDMAVELAKDPGRTRAAYPWAKMLPAAPARVPSQPPAAKAASEAPGAP